MCRVAHLYRLPVSTVYGWPHSDLVAAVASIVTDSERCTGCGLSDDDAWHVEAQLYTCPTCEDRDRQLESLRDQKSTAGWRARFTQLLTESDRMLFSSAVNYTKEGAEARAKYRAASRL